MNPKRIVVVGSINLDLVGSAPRLPCPGETITGSGFSVFHGGKGANQAIAVARLGYPAAMVAKVGEDEFGGRLRRALRASGVLVRNVGVAAGVSSGVALITVDRAAQNAIVVIPGANGEVRPKDIDDASALLASAAMILAQLEIPLDTVEHLAHEAQRFHVPLMLDPAPARRLPARLLQMVTYLTPNETESATLCNRAPCLLSPAAAAEQARRLRAMGPQNVIIKMGSQGAYVSAAGFERFVPAFRVDSVDSTAAGDAFNAGLAVGITMGKGLEESCRFACAVAALSTMHKGAQPSMPSREAVRRFLGVSAVA